MSRSLYRKHIQVLTIKNQSKITDYRIGSTSGMRRNNPGVRMLLEFWSKYCTLTPWHETWVRQQVTVLSVKRGEVLSWSGDRQKMVYFVCNGMLARVRQVDKAGVDKRMITSIALPGIALTTSTHLYRSTPHKGDIVALRSGLVIGIPYKAVKAYKELEPSVETLIDILIHKKKRQLETHIQILRSTSPFERYLLFDKLMPEIRSATNQNEQADFLGISRRTVQAASYFLLTGERPKK